jgi:polar amino acid transport system permease protein
MFRTARVGPTFAPLGVDATPQQVVERVSQSRSRARRRFRLEFILTWLVLVGGLVVAIAFTGRVKLDFIFEWAPFIIGGVSITIFVSAMAIVFATLFAVIGALGRLSRVAPIYAAATLYVSLIRGTPLIIQLFVWYLALPQFGIVLPGIACGIFGLAFNYGAYMTEIFRAGIQAIPRGQVEAAAALGMTERMTMRRIVLPQAMRVIIPPTGNETISMLKNTSLVSVIGYAELLYSVQIIYARTFQTIPLLIVASIWYLAMTSVLYVIQHFIERRYSRGSSRHMPAARLAVGGSGLR